MYLLEKMDQDVAHMVAASKVPMLKPKEFKIWRMRIEKYIQMIDYSLWEVIENGNSLPKTQTVECVETVMPITSTKHKAHIRLEVKARSTLMMGIPNEHQLKFNSIKDANSLLEAIKKSFGGNDATKKTQRNLVYKLEVKGLSSSITNTQNMAFVSSSLNNNTNSSNEAVNTAFGVTTAGIQVNAAKSTNIDKIAMLIMRSRRFLKNTRRKLNLNGDETVAFDKTKVECFNCHKRGHFARECKALRAQDNRNKERTRRNVPFKTTNSSALVSCDGLGSYD
nr:hypothetical protein [Tanacetum cinerariifolium]